ncbi:MAG: 4Fe-4S dicluster domain-containing protein [Candidatus Jordarchaeaceae archaeon]
MAGADIEKTVVDAESLDSSFLRKVLKHPGGEQILVCFQCGVCSSSCPLRLINPEYNPRKIVKKTILGMKDQVLSSDFIWFCADCNACTERCPQGVNPSEVMRAIKNVAVEEGIIPAAVKKIVENLEEHGRVYPLEEFTQEEREMLDLPELEPDVKIFKIDRKKLLGERS